MRRGITLGLALVAVTLLSAPTANAGTYKVYGCKGSKGQSYGTDGWVGVGGGKTTQPMNSCSSKGGSLWARVPGSHTYSVNDYVGWAFRAPAGTEISDYTVYRSAVVTKSTAPAVPIYYLAWPTATWANAKDKCSGANCDGLGSSKSPFGTGNRIRAGRTMTGVKTLTFRAECGGAAGKTCTNAATPAGKDASRFNIYGSQITLRDNSYPARTGPPSGAVAAGEVSGVPTISVPLADTGGGVASIAVIVDGREQARYPSAEGCKTPYTRTVPCPLTTTMTVPVDTRGLANSAHSLRLIARDAAGNAAVVHDGGFVSDNYPDSAFSSSVKRDYGVTTRGTRFTRMTINDLVDGARIELRCSGGHKRRCPFSKKTYRDKKSSDRRSVVSKLRKRTLRPGAKLRVRVLGADRSVRQVTYRIRSRKRPSSKTLCRLGESGSKYRSCPR